MIDVRALEKNQPDPQTGKTYLQEYTETIRNRGGDVSQVDQLVQFNKERKRLIVEAETRKAEQNKVGQVIAQKKRNKEDATKELEQMQKVSVELKDLEKATAEADQKVADFAARLPNKLHNSVPIGKSDKDNVVVRSVGEPRKFSFKPKEHWEIGEALGMIDFERGAKVTGARFAFLKKAVARLERAVMAFMLDLHADTHGYTEIWPPFIVNNDSLFGTGQLPKFGEDLFKLENLNYYLIPTAEVPVTNYYRDEILNESDLPQRFVGFSPCFRAEAGSYGKDTKGLIRQHQFDKVELVKFSHPSRSYEEHESLTQNAEEVLKRLEIAYHVASLCSGDISFGAAKCYDINVWLPGQAAFREISSCSNFEDFQARRANIRFKPSDGGKPQFVHTLNGSGLAIGRTVIAILENYQNEDGTVDIPRMLLPYMGGLKKIE